MKCGAVKRGQCNLRVKSAWLPVSPVDRVVYLDISNVGKTENWVDCMFPLGFLALLFISLHCLSPYNLSCLFTLDNIIFSLDFQKLRETKMQLLYLKLFSSFMCF